MRHDLLIAKLHGNGYSHAAFKLINDYPTNRQQRVEVGGSFIAWKDVTFGMPQESVSGPFSFHFHFKNIYPGIQFS